MAKIRDYSISGKLTRMNMLVSGAALLLACVAFVAYDVLTFRQAIAHNLSIEAQITGSNSVSALLFNDPREVERTLSALKVAPNIVSAHIYTPGGQPFAGYWRDGDGQAPAPPAIPRGQSEAHWFKDGQVVLVHAIVFQGKPTGMVYIRRDLQDINERLARYAGIAAIVMLMCLFAALQASSLSQKSIAEPIVKLADLARTVSRDKDYSVRARPTGSRDELATLIETFNEMLAQIQERDRALQEAHGELEQRVQERTGELAKANERLRKEISERKNITEALQASEERFRNLAEAASNAILSADSRGNIVYCNRVAEQIFSYTSEELIGQSLSVLMPERFRDGHRQGFDRFLKTGESRVIGKTVELAARRKDGTEFPIELSLSSWKTHEGAFFTGILNDITERKQAENVLQRQRKELAESNAGLVEANKELESFSYSVSHDLRAPLRTIDGFSHALLEDCADRLDDAGKTHLNRIRAATQRMGLLIDDLLNLSRLSRTEMHTQSLDIIALACSIARALQIAQPERRIELRIEDGLKTTADPGLLRVVLENLLSNAWKFTSKRESAHIAFGMARGNGTPAYFVRDDGVGFDPAYADRLFGAFQRLHATTEFAGTGVGLATVQRIVHRHGGHIWAESAVGQGATFYFTMGETAT